MKPTKAQLKKLYPILEGDIEPPRDAPDDWTPSVEDVAGAVLAKAWELYEERAKFVVVGQKRHDRRVFRYKTRSERPLMVSLGAYESEGVAKSAGRSLAYSAATGDEMRWWLVPYHKGSPADFHQELKKEIVLEDNTEGARSVPVPEWGDAIPNTCYYPLIGREGDFAFCHLRAGHEGPCDEGFIEEEEE